MTVLCVAFTVVSVDLMIINFIFCGLLLCDFSHFNFQSSGEVKNQVQALHFLIAYCISVRHCACEFLTDILSPHVISLLNLLTKHPFIENKYSLIYVLTDICKGRIGVVTHADEALKMNSTQLQAF
uniref:Uncharacterized protein n=1 Tax=Glossina palpalis gambiensis TaxID=67801 RepID=A0A1B0B136_9MUSC